MDHPSSPSNLGEHTTGPRPLDDIPGPPTWTPPAIPGLSIVDVVARGGHGTVYRARQHEHDRTVALKVLDGPFSDDSMRRRFERERIALGRLSDHPAIVGLLDSGETAVGAPYLLLEYAPGGTLDDRLQRGALGFDEATEIGVVLAAALERAHVAGIVHNDIKPSNVMRSAYGDWMLTDFGIASLIDRSLTTNVHTSYAHTAPETFDGAAPSPAGDVYSLASVIATCLTGEEPFAVAPDEATVSAMRRITTEPYPDLRRAGVHHQLAALLEMALSKDPDRRPVSARSFAMALNDLRRGAGLLPVPVRVGGETADGATVTVGPEELAAVHEPAPSHRRARRVPRRAVRLVALAACVAGAALGVSSLYADRSGVDEVAAGVIADSATDPAADPATESDVDDTGSPIEDLGPDDEASAAELDDLEDTIVPTVFVDDGDGGELGDGTADDTDAATNDAGVGAATDGGGGNGDGGGGGPGARGGDGPAGRGDRGGPGGGGGPGNGGRPGNGPGNGGGN